MSGIKTMGTFALLGWWTIGPTVSIQSNENGRWSIQVGAGAGQYEVVTRNCAGDITSTRPVEFTSGGALVEYETSGLRLDAFGGVTTVPEGFARDGAYVGGTVSYEASIVGIGAGAVALPGGSAPSIYLRVGPRDRTHLRTDFLAPDPTPGVAGLFRLGLGFPIGRARGLAGFSAGRGLDMEEISDWGGLFGDFTIPLGETWGLRLAGSFSPFSEDYADWGAGIGLTFHPH
jgi:hypothetical protein